VALHGPGGILFQVQVPAVVEEDGLDGRSAVGDGLRKSVGVRLPEPRSFRTLIVSDFREIKSTSAEQRLMINAGKA